MKPGDLSLVIQAKLCDSGLLVTRVSAPGSRNLVMQAKPCDPGCSLPAYLSQKSFESARKLTSYHEMDTIIRVIPYTTHEAIEHSNQP